MGCNTSKETVPTEGQKDTTEDTSEKKGESKFCLS